MGKFRLSSSGSDCRTPCKCKCSSRKQAQHLSPAQKNATKISLKYKRGYRKSPGKLIRVKEALADVGRGIPITRAARNHDLSESFLRRRLSGEVSLDSRNGPQPIFSKKEEEELAMWLSE
ncbi:hypothetical protein DPMN_010048 [Dreissena polymorpha]|uniref:HTH psq-type domain-containing protein n=1 Tax=Dreissena polymorpha TaxID=45954 RepID=A0A9D4N3F8_DREPO|nr:hypothetical protein DPMN_010048 [Dreissena polymorpha]